jgi:hypothetical protein
LWSFYAERLNDASRLILGASALKRIIAEEDSIESARAVSAVFGIATLCDEISVRQLLGCLVISIFEKLQRLAPLEYRDEDSFEYCASEDSLDLSPESGEAHKFDGVGNYYDKQVRGDAAQVTQLVKEWGVVFKSGLQALCGLPPCDERGEQLFDIINSSPMTMPELSEVLDALLCASKEQFHSALKYLAENAHVDGRACVCLLAVADYINRKDVDPQSLPCDPVEMICEVLNEVNQEDLIVIVGQCKMLLNSRPEYFYDKDLTSAIFEKLLARLSDRLKQQEAI